METHVLFNALHSKDTFLAKIHYHDFFRDGGDRNDRGGYNRGGRDDGRATSADDWTIPLPRNERIEQELFTGGHGPSGINFDRYEDIPVEATGSNVPEGIEDVSLI